MKSLLSTLTLLSLTQLAPGANFTLLKDHSGNGFFDDWAFFGNYNNLTNGTHVHPNFNLPPFPDHGGQLVQVMSLTSTNPTLPTSRLST